MNILAITQSKDILGGANRSLFDVLMLLRDIYGHRIFVVTPGEGDFTKELKKEKIDYICVKYNQVSFVQMGDLKDPARYIRAAIRDRKNKRVAIELSRQFTERKFDVVYINDTTNTFGYYLAKVLGLPYVWHFRGYHQTIAKYLLRDRVFRRDADGMSIAISQSMKDYMVRVRKMAPDRIKVIHNGVTNAGVQIKQPWEQSITDGLHCVHCGHLSEAKGQTESILAIAELKKRGYENIYLHLAGSPLVAHGKSYKDTLLKMVDKYSLTSQIIFEGEVKNMGGLRQKMQIELMCSVAEPFGRVTVEGMQAGLVVIGCDTGATPEIITDNINGMIYHRGNIVELADKIEAVYNNHALGNRLSQGALKTVLTKFTMRENVKQINEVLEQRGNKEG